MGGRTSSSGMSSGGGVTPATWDTAGTRQFIESQIDGLGLGISKEDLASRVYRAMHENGADVAILNGKYLTVKGANGEAELQFVKSKAEGAWKLAPMLGYNDVVKGRHLGQTMYKAVGEWFARKSDAEWAFVKSKLG